MKHYLGIDIGGTAVKLGIVDETGAVLAKAEESVSFDGYRTPILTTVLKAAQAFLAAQSVPAESLAGIGVSATGQIDSRKGIVAGTCGNLPNYIGAPIKAELEKTFGLPVTVANDANCMTLGEVWVGGAQGYTDVIGVTLGTGVGGGILTGGRLLEGARGLGGELGHYRTHALDGVDCWGGKAPNILVVAPPCIKDGFHDAVMGAGCVEKSRGVAEQLRIVAERQGVHFMDAAECEFNEVDFMHLTCKGHARLAELLTAEVPKLV